MECNLNVVIFLTALSLPGCLPQPRLVAFPGLAQLPSPFPPVRGTSVPGTLSSGEQSTVTFQTWRNARSITAENASLTFLGSLPWVIKVGQLVRVRPKLLGMPSLYQANALAFFCLLTSITASHF